jgi:glutamine amidotransferase
MITIVDYGVGNIHSIVNMLRALGFKSRIAKDASEIGNAERLILPGVGHFDYGMRSLRSRGLVEALQQRVLGDGIPILGICLGAQLLTRGSEEGHEPGLSWIAGNTVAFDRARLGSSLRVPHMGWANTWQVRETPLTTALPADARFYYVHSFHLTCDNDDDAAFMAHHGYEFVAGFHRENILGVQFHPEKSHRFGMQIIRNFCTWKPRSRISDLMP